MVSLRNSQQSVAEASSDQQDIMDDDSNPAKLAKQVKKVALPISYTNGVSCYKSPLHTSDKHCKFFSSCPNSIMVVPFRI